MADSLGERLAAHRRRAKLSQSQVAKAIGVARPTVSSWETGADKPGRDRIAALAALYRVTIDELMAGSTLTDRNLLSSDVTNVPPAPGRGAPLPSASDSCDQLPRDIPVYGVVRGGSAEDGEFELNGQVIECVRRPPGLTTAVGIFALWICGDSMSPKFGPRDLIYVHPRRQPRPGDDVVIELHPRDGEAVGPAFVKRLVKRTSDEVVVEQFNPPKQITFPAAALKAVMLILTVAELMGP